MYSKPEQLLDKYPLTVKSFSKGRECYLCDTSLGYLALREYRGSKERAAFLAKMLVHLKENGLLVESIVQSKEGEILVTDEEERKFFLCENYYGVECDTKKEADMLAAVRLLARMHNVSKKFSGEVPDLISRNRNSLLDLCEKHNRELRQVKNYIRSKKKKNAFEMMFIKEYQPFYEKAQAITEALKNIECDETLYGFCHGDYNQHSIVIAKQGTALVGLERFTYDLQIRDLANFIRKMMEKNNWNVDLGMALIGAYNEIHVMQEQEGQYLYFFLAYPEKFWKLANHYNNAHKSWLSERNVEKLEKVISQEEKREGFLQELRKRIPLLFLDRIGYT